MTQAKLERSEEIPAGINVEISGREIIARKGNAEVRKKFRTEIITFEKKDNKIVFSCKENKKRYRAIMNTFIAILRNMFRGLEKEYVYKMKIVHAHFPITVQKKEGFLEVHNFGGEKKPRIAKIVGATVVEIKGKDIILRGPSKEDVGQTAANLEKVSRVKNRDLRVFQDGIYLTEKDSTGE